MYLFGARGEQVIADRWCRGVPLSGLACPEDPGAREEIKPRYTVRQATARMVRTNGTLEREAIAKVINAHLNELLYCYERAVLTAPGLAGKLELEWHLDAAGKVTAVRQKSSTISHSKMNECAVSAVQRWRFARSATKDTTISFPFLFVP